MTYIRSLTGSPTASPEILVSTNTELANVIINSSIKAGTLASVNDVKFRWDPTSTDDPSATVIKPNDGTDPGRWLVDQIGIADLPKANDTDPGILALSGDLGGSFDNPSVNQISGQRVPWKSSVRFVITSNTSLSSFTVAQSEGTAVANDRVLLTNQSDKSQNGIYKVGTVSGSTAPLTRATDMASSADVLSGSKVYVSQGTLFGNTEWVLSTQGTIVLGTTALRFTPDKTPTIAALRQVSGISDGQQVSIDSYSIANDGGGGTFQWNSSSTDADNTGTIIAPNGVSTGRWFRKFAGALHVEWFGVKGDNTTDDSSFIAATIASLGDTSILRAGRIALPNKTMAIASTLALTSKSGIIEGKGTGVVSGDGCALRWSGTAGSPTIQVRKSSGLQLRDFRLTCLDPNIKPSAAIDFNVQVSETLSNTNFSVENIGIGGFAGDTITLGTATIKNPDSTSPDITITGSSVVAGIFVWVSTGGARGTAKIKIATGGYSLDPTSTTWIDASGNPVTFSSAHEFTTSATVAIPSTVYVLNCATGTYVLNDTYRYDATAFNNGITISGINSQNDQFTFRRVVVQAVRDIGIDLQNSQSTTGIIDECKFNDVYNAIQTKSRILNVRGCFFSTIYGACVRQLSDAGVRVTDCGAEGCGRFIYADAGLVEIESCYYQPNARFLPSIGTGADAFIWQNGLDDTNGHCFMTIKKCNFTTDGTLGGRIPKIKVSGCKTAVMILEDVQFGTDATVTDYLAHIDMTTNQAGQTRFLVFTFGGKQYVKYWEHGDHANEVGGARVDEPLPLNLRRGIGAVSIDTAGNTHGLIQLVPSGPFSGFCQVGDTSTPTVTQDIKAITSGCDIRDYRNITGLIGYIEQLHMSSEPGAPAAGECRIWLGDNGAGKMQLKVRFPSGASQVIATEP